MLADEAPWYRDAGSVMSRRERRSAAVPRMRVTHNSRRLRGAHATMTGRIRRNLLAQRLQVLPSDETLICPLCERPIPDAQKDAHHLVPKSKGGRHTQYLHRICHRQIHALLTEAELARQYSTVDALLAHPAIARFVSWVKTKPDHFYERTRKSEHVRGR